VHDLTKEKLTPARSAHFRRLRILGQTTGWIVFFIAVYLSGRLGVEMARDRLPDVDKEAPETLSDASLTVGKSDDPIYLARSPEELRAFFTNYPTPQERATANLIGSGIRRLQDSVEMRTIRAEADAVEVKVFSGAIAGAVYWIHYTQLPDPSSFNPIISPLPGQINAKAIERK
jgi:hypothetical protein